MSKPVKAMVTAELRRRYEGMNSACVVDLTGLDVQEQEALRRVVRAKRGRIEVVKNAMAKRAFADTGLEPIGRTLEGPCALVTSSESLIEVAKALVASAKDFAELTLKQAIFDGDPTLVTVEELSKMRGKVELLGEVAMLITSPGRAIAGCLSSPQAKIAGCLKTMVDKAA
ncbi:MAG: 50S ribosomal protein L10 [Phycisphaerales bacterium]|nr:MAG: 50S ribosomal protein L10 [Phycisphaerales bacterium]